ncbi:putative DNA alkylation repair enzyme [Rubellimicrobium thermophilum DSM 16684]|uniref:Putative DNA alkylation repair enzyme n=1 Tax=Rubellimicrobium thermophilum DSM 16684 TaxID=1123069 RepID=S9R5U8_9RHOB|nr:DNA alkylation repair protein [Rubellimicrobium thermophilum]EPX87368.1 putative DNA alkylation repair enzyme [Rubellimicrobium thermophilum DSM 16684]
MTPQEALAALEARGDAARAAAMAARHRAPRRYLGVAGPQIAELAGLWRAQTDLAGRIALAAGLWDSNVHEARIAAARLLTQARIRPDDEAVWRLVASWVPQFDEAAIADHAAQAGSRRLVADPRRLEAVEGWVGSAHPWTRRAALTFTLPWTKGRHPKPADIAARERILGWCARLATDAEPVVRRAVAEWLRILSRHDPERVRAWRADRGEPPTPRPPAGRPRS